MAASASPKTATEAAATSEGGTGGGSSCGCSSTSSSTAATAAGGGPTPKEEIERQHLEAVTIVEEGSLRERECPPPFVGEISAAHKSRPTDQLSLPGSSSEDEEKKADAEESTQSPPPSLPPCWSHRGTVDVSALRNLFREGYNTAFPAATNKSKGEGKGEDGAVVSETNLWDEANAAANNVKICRPSHDAWGIKKVVLVFSDDFLQRTFEMPWWHLREDVREAVQPVLDVLGVGKDHGRIARMLLASLPPGVTIPVHHDTGEWVKKTHRVHVPIFVADPSRVLFRTGLTADEMERIDCVPGRVFELNNMAKHAVSNCDADHRVHMIIDYFDDGDGNGGQDGEGGGASRERIRLDPGEVLLQTRRSVDRKSDRGARKTPSYLILGAQKAGTTSLYEYLNQHPLVVRARRRETHCFDWRWNDGLKTTDRQRQWCHKFYHKDELDAHPSCLTGDSTPSYLLDSRRVIPRLKRVFDWDLKFFVMLREPVRRAESHYAMATSKEGTEAQLKARGGEWREKSIRDVIKDEIRQMSEIGLIPYFDVETGAVDDGKFDAFAGTAEEDEAWDRYLALIPLNTGSHCLVGRGMYELNLRPWFRAYGRSHFLVLRLESFQDGDTGGRNVDREMKKVWAHLGIPAISLDDDAPKNQRQYDSLLDDDMQAYLRRFYEPHNRRLAAVLGGEGGRKDAWW